MPHRRVQLKNPFIAGVLSFLIPGAGHLYQQRFFKGVLYLVCILGTFLSGLALGEGKVVYLRTQQGQKTWGYLSQVLVGLPALPALFQFKRYNEIDPDLKQDGIEKIQRLPEGLSTTFSGRMRRQNSNGETIEGPLRGHIELTPDPGSNGLQLTGTFRGTFDGREIELPLTSPVSVGPKVIASEDIHPQFLVDVEERPKRKFSSRERYFMCQILEQPGGGLEAGLIEGTIPRGFWDWFQVPLEDSAEQDLNGRLGGKRYELAMVFTWIAGLLNILVVWDAIQGPAYGYGDEHQPEKKQTKEKETVKPDSGSTSPASSPIAEGQDSDEQPLVNTQSGRSPNSSITPRH